MKLLCRLAFKVQNSETCKFTWLNRDHNWLFTIENGTKMRIFRVDKAPGEQIQSTSLAEGRVCTSLSWNMNATVLALVIDKRQIYFWDLKSNSFSQYKPSSRLLDGAGTTKTRKGDIELVRWSKLTNRLAICFSSGQIIIYRYEPDSSEKLIDNCDGVLRQISCIEVGEDHDVFACTTIINEILVMTFDGETKAYIQSRDLSIIKVRFSPVHKASFGGGQSVARLVGDGSAFMGSQDTLASLSVAPPGADPRDEPAVWLAHKTSDHKILLKRISLGNSGLTENNKADLTYDGSEDPDGHTVNFYWLSSSRLVCCNSSGVVRILQIREIPTKLAAGGVSLRLVCEQMLDLSLDLTFKMSGGPNGRQTGEKFNKFEMKRNQSTHKDDGRDKQAIATESRNTNGSESSFALVAITWAQIFYYKIELDHENGRSSYNFEMIDRHSLAALPQKVKQTSLRKVSLSSDCSMLAVQLKNSNVLVFRTRLPSYMVVSHHSKAAYLSSPNEATILNFATLSQARGPQQQAPDSREANSTSPTTIQETTNINNDALRLDFGEFRPSLIAVGPAHLAVALNNRVRLYLIAMPSDQSRLLGEAKQVARQDYLSIAVAIRLSCRYAAVQFDDGRLKLHSIPSGLLDDQEELENERFFPDPDKLESICCFALTEQLLIYSTRELNLVVFSLNSWNFVQTLDHSRSLGAPISRMAANPKGNKLICLRQWQQPGSRQTLLDESVYLFDVQSNKLLRGFNCPLYETFLDGHHQRQQQQRQVDDDQGQLAHLELVGRKSRPKLVDRIVDVIWDSDGRSVLLVEEKQIHNLVVIEHTLGQVDSAPLLEYADRTRKATSYSTLYASGGVVAFQTPLGRMVNLVLGTHDDELKLSTIEHEVELLRTKLADGPSAGVTLAEAQSRIVQLKLIYLSSIMPIYSLSKCKQICEYLTSDHQLNLGQDEATCALDLAAAASGGQSDTGLSASPANVWLHLLRWALFCLDLNCALAICREHGLVVQARLLSKMSNDARQRGQDSRVALRGRLLEVLQVAAS